MECDEERMRRYGRGDGEEIVHDRERKTKSQSLSQTDGKRAVTEAKAELGVESKTETNA